jgi:glycerol-3-phosphate dehydrogenase
MHVAVGLEPNQAVYVVAIGETREDMMFVLPHTLCQITGETDIQRF